MLDIMDRSQGRVLGLEIRGKIHGEEMRHVAHRLEDIIAAHGKASVLVHVETLPGFDLQALFEDLKFTVRHWRDIDRLAVVGDSRWLEPYVRVVNVLMPRAAQVCHFTTDNLATAWDWLEESAPAACDDHAPMH